MQKKKLWIFVDGAARGNPGPAGIGILIKDESGRIVSSHKEYLGNMTNNQAEYSALIKALEMASRLGGNDLKVISDSELLVNHLTGKYVVRSKNLRGSFEKVRRLEQSFTRINYRHVSREKNEQADMLANSAIDDAL